MGGLKLYLKTLIGISIQNFYVYAIRVQLFKLNIVNTIRRNYFSKKRLTVCILQTCKSISLCSRWRRLILDFFF